MGARSRMAVVAFGVTAALVAAGCGSSGGGSSAGGGATGAGGLGVGGVEGVYGAEPIPATDLLARKTAGNAVELASILAVGWSPSPRASYAA